MFEFLTNLFTPVLILFGFTTPMPVTIPVEPPPIVEVVPETVPVATTTPEIVVTEPMPVPTPQVPTPVEVPAVVSEPIIEPVPIEMVSVPEETVPAVATNTEPEVAEIVFPKPECGPAHKDTLLAVPNTNLCEVGTVSDTHLEDTQYTWQCLSGDQKISCMVSITEHGACGVSSDVLLPSGYSSDVLCSAGELSSKKSEYGEVTWTCRGINDGYDAQCSADIKTAGVCGSAHAAESQHFPASNLCRYGKALNKQSADTYTWECAGINGGSNASCFANTPEPETPVIPCYKDAFLTPC